MAYKDAFIRVSFGGSLADTQEIWSCSFHLARFDETLSSTAWFNAVTSQINPMGTLLEEFASNPMSLLPATVTLDWMKMALVGTDGKNIGDALSKPLSATGGQPGGYIPQASVCYTFDSGKWKNPGKYNRFYLPASNQAVLGTWHISPVMVQEAADTCGTLVNEINSLVGPTDDPTGAVVAVVSGTGTGTTMKAQRVRVGSIVDTQRRRRNQLVESYKTTEIV